MKKITTLLTTLVLATFLLAACNPPAEPDGYTANDSVVNISDYKGKWVVVNYWAVWCEPCLDELPELNTLYENHKDDVMVLGVSFDLLTDKDVLTFAESMKLTFPMLMSFDLEKYGVDHVPALPMTFIFSPEGEIVKSLNGPQTEASLLEAMGL